jgi:hypothetical protein
VLLLLALPEFEADERRRAATRYSTLALPAVALVALTGLERAYDEVTTVHRALSTGFGQLVDVKIVLLAVLVALGALNRYRAVEAVSASPRLLGIVGRVELTLVVAILAATAILQGLAPPASSATPAKPLMVTGNDVATTLKVRLSVAPGFAGFNRFTVRVTDFDTAAPVEGLVSLSFSLPSRPDLGSSTLALSRSGPGSYAADGPNLSLDGTWRVIVTVQEPTGGVDVPLTVTPKRPPEPVRVAPQGAGLPTLYTVELPGGASIQTYLDPDKPGLDEFHVTFLTPNGDETPMSAATVTATAGKSGAIALAVRRLDDVGHFVADLHAAKATYRFDITGATAAGGTIEGTVTIAVK